MNALPNLPNTQASTSTTPFSTPQSSSKPLPLINAAAPKKSNVLTFLIIGIALILLIGGGIIIYTIIQANQSTATPTTTVDVELQKKNIENSLKLNNNPETPQSYTVPISY